MSIVIGVCPPNVIFIFVVKKRWQTQIIVYFFGRCVHILTKTTPAKQPSKLSEGVRMRLNKKVLFLCKQNNK